jgi:hypothetical protein
MKRCDPHEPDRSVEATMILTYSLTAAIVIADRMMGDLPLVVTVV